MNTSTTSLAGGTREAAAPERSPLPDAIITGIIAGVLVALTPTLQNAIGEHSISMAYGVICGCGTALLLTYTARTPQRSRRHVPAAMGLGALALVFIGGLVLSSVAPGTTITVAAGVLVGLVVAALVYGARRIYAQQMEQLRADLASHRPAAPSEEAGSARDYSPLDALADISSSYGALADRAVTPKWYYPVVAIGLSGMTLAVGLDAPWWVTITVAAASLAISVTSVFIYRRMTGLTFTAIAPGRARTWFYLTSAAMLGGVVVAMGAASIGSLPLAIVAALIPLIGVPVFGTRYDACLRDAIRAGEYTGGVR